MVRDMQVEGLISLIFKYLKTGQHQCLQIVLTLTQLDADSMFFSEKISAYRPGRPVFPAIVPRPGGSRTKRFLSAERDPGKYEPRLLE